MNKIELSLDDIGVKITERRVLTSETALIYEVLLSDGSSRSIKVSELERLQCQTPAEMRGLLIEKLESQTTNNTSDAS